MRIARRLSLLSLIFAPTLGCSSSPTDLPDAPVADPNDVDIVAGASSKAAAAFSPNPKTLSLAGAATVTMRWVNRDLSSDGYNMVGVTHHIVSNDGTSFDTGDIGGNGMATKNLAEGTYPYHCSIHPTMTGTVTVTP